MLATPCPTAASSRSKRAMRFSTMIIAAPTLTHAPPVRHDCRVRRRDRHDEKRRGAGIRTVLFDKRRGSGHGARPEPSLRFHQAIEGTHQDLQRGRRRDHRQNLPSPLIAGNRPQRRGRAGGRGGRGGWPFLVVEDDRDVRAYLVELLRDLNYRVLSAHDAVAALDRDRRHPYRSAFDRRGATRHERPAAGGTSKKSATGYQGAIYDGLFAKRHRPPRPARSRRCDDPKADHPRRARGTDTRLTRRQTHGAMIVSKEPRDYVKAVSCKLSSRSRSRAVPS